MTSAAEVDLAVSVGSVRLPNPVMPASGTAGHGTELGAYVDLGGLGAVVVKSLAATPWPGNPPLRVHQTPAGMINSVGLQGPGVERWLVDDLPGLLATGARVVASIWGRSVDEYRAAADLLAEAPPGVVAVEVNLSCPNVSGHGIFAQSAPDSAAVIAATAGCGRPRWAKLTPLVTDITEVAGAVLDAGAEALTVANTVPGLAIDVETRRSHLGGGMGGLSGPAIHPIAVRAVYECRAAHPDAAIVGVGGIARGVDAVEMLLAGADAVQVGTATFADPRACAVVLDELAAWCRAHDVPRVADLTGGAHDPDR
ncbi:dihydroorotate dehydrogenase [Actinomarinicola tropica]|uniref:Dihydroorotate dehydrogenase n=1 Tax=Actinomarinicola tropica TaxID=2789776 RepID=A0A5Q2RMQ3_9ACTN|nr:dihydroorotate dehydrogenase [Actinomarinicola tropica]QGG95180.1 dihydroorotate dehydrogenase [Actinomarinicola tropica]